MDRLPPVVRVPPVGSAFAICLGLLGPFPTGGVFFVNFKLRDHTLISLDGRYFAYYRDASVPLTMLRNAGFHIDEIALRWNDRTLYDVSKSIQWANFYCRRLK